MNQPIQVDAVTSIWDVLQTVADMVAGLGAAGALLIAALVYRREVQDKRRQLASKVLVHVEDGQIGKQVKVSNGGELPVFKVRWEIESPENPMVLAKYSESGEFKEVTAFEPATQFLHEYPDGRGFRGSVKFCDSSGQAWERHTDGSLYELRDSSYWQESARRKNDGVVRRLMRRR